MNEPYSNSVAAVVRAAQIIVGSLILGAALLAGTFIVMRDAGVGGVPATPILTYVLLAVAIVEFGMFALLPGRLTAMKIRELARGTRQDAVDASRDLNKLLEMFIPHLLIGCALVEGATFSLLIAYFIEGQLVSLITSGLLIAVLVLQLPTRMKVEAWIDKNLQRLQDERLAGAC